MTTSDLQSTTIYGKQQPPRRPIHAHAGPVRFVIEDGMIKHVRIGGIELVRRVYFAVRTDEWDTIYPVFSDLEIDSTAETFRASWRAKADGGAVKYEWAGTIQGDADGTIRFTARGEPKTDFGSNRIGLCLLLSAQTLGGKEFTLTKVDGSEKRGTFAPYVYPDLVAAQFTGLRYRPPGGPVVECRMDGAVFDMEDQRLYMETTYKAYAPLPHQYPQVRAGEDFEQTFTMRLPDGPGAVSTQVNPSNAPVTVTLGDLIPGAQIPGLGLTLRPDHELTDREIGELSGLKLAHLRLEIDVAAADCVDRVADALPAVGSIAPALLISARNVCEASLDRLSAIVRLVEASPLARLLIEAGDANPELLPVIREAVLSNDLIVEVGGPGSDDVSGHPGLPAWAAARPDFLCWAGSPAIHQEDDETLMENTAGITGQMAAVRQYAGRVPLAMGPFKLDGAWPRPRPTPRHTGLFAATWLVSAIKHLGESGASFATLFEATGPAGVLYRAESFPQPGFDGTGRCRFPAYDVISWFSRLRGKLLQIGSTDGLRVEGLAVLPDDGADVPTCILINKTFCERKVELTGVSGKRVIYTYTGISSDTGEPAAPGTRRGMFPGDSASTIVLPPYGLLWLVPE